MSNTLIIRCVEHKDFSQWKQLWEGYNRFYGQNTLPEEITQMTWSRFFDDSEPVHAMVAEKDEKILGLVHYLFHRSTIQIGMSCYLQDLFTSEAARAQGIGRALIEAVSNQAKISGSPRIYWQTQENNLGARRLYDQVATLSDFVIYSKKI